MGSPARDLDDSHMLGRDCEQEERGIGLLKTLSSRPCLLMVTHDSEVETMLAQMANWITSTAERAILKRNTSWQVM